MKKFYKNNDKENFFFYNEIFKNELKSFESNRSYSIGDIYISKEKIIAGDFKKKYEFLLEQFLVMENYEKTL